jgi:hypothetical protein
MSHVWIISQELEDLQETVKNLVGRIDIVLGYIAQDFSEIGSRLGN